MFTEKGLLIGLSVLESTPKEVLQKCLKRIEQRGLKQGLQQMTQLKVAAISGTCIKIK